ncbi:MAG: hypothetical protein ACOCUL_02340, partial [Bacteroidota bacterium]
GITYSPNLVFFEPGEYSMITIGTHAGLGYQPFKDLFVFDLPLVTEVHLGRDPRKRKNLYQKDDLFFGGGIGFQARTDFTSYSTSMGILMNIGIVRRSYGIRFSFLKNMTKGSFDIYSLALIYQL